MILLCSLICYALCYDPQYLKVRESKHGGEFLKIVMICIELVNIAFNSKQRVYYGKSKAMHRIFSYNNRDP